jgi:hypothetical protein
VHAAACRGGVCVDALRAEGALEKREHANAAAGCEGACDRDEKGLRHGIDNEEERCRGGRRLRLVVGRGGVRGDAGGRDGCGAESQAAARTFRNRRGGTSSVGLVWSIEHHRAAALPVAAGSVVPVVISLDHRQHATTANP